MVKNQNKNNFFFAPAVVAIMQFAYIFISLFRSGFFFEVKVLLVSVAIVMFWLFSFIYYTVVLKRYLFHSSMFLPYFILFVILGFYFIDVFWFSNYLSLHPMQTFLDGGSHNDTLFHSTIAESFRINGYSSLVLNFPTYFGYHFLSHFMISSLSTILNIPCFIVYNYLFPILFVPLFLYLIQSCVYKYRLYYGLEDFFDIKDYVFMLFVCIGILPNNFLDRMGFFWTSVYVSESCFFGIIIFLLVIELIFSLVLKNKFSIFLLFLIGIPLIPIFLFSKISIGALFCAGLCYFLFRKNPKQLKTYVFCAILLLTLFISYRLYSIGNMHTLDKMNFVFFHFAKTYSSSWVYGFFLYLFFFFPVFIITLFNKKVMFSISKDMKDTQIILSEIFLLLSIFACIPGVLFPIIGGSAIYFMLPIFFLGELMVWAQEFPKKFIDFIFIRYTFQHRFNMVYVLVIVIFVHLYPALNILPNLTRTFKSLEIVNTELESSQKILLCFDKSQYVENGFYKVIKDICMLALPQKKKSCIFITDEAPIYRMFNKNDDLRSTMNNGFALNAITGLPVINAYYVINDCVYKGNGDFIGTTTEVYDLYPSIKLSKKITEDNMTEYAKKMGYKYIIVIREEGYHVLGL